MRIGPESAGRAGADVGYKHVQMGRGWGGEQARTRDREGWGEVRCEYGALCGRGVCRRVVVCPASVRP